LGYRFRIVVVRFDPGAPVPGIKLCRARFCYREQRVGVTEEPML
jgi:hypothetical protein